VRDGRTSRARVAVVTGGGGGIGGEASLELARRGHTVVVMDPGDGVQGEPLGEPTAEEVAGRINAAGGRSIASKVSVTDRDGLRALFRSVVDDFGSLDIIVNAAGIVRFSRFVEASQDDWTFVFGVHFDGYLNVLSEALPIMSASGYGRIVAFTSGVGLARTSGDGVAYGAAKRAVAALTWRLGTLLPEGISVNALSPIAATRMVREGLERAGVGPKGLDLSNMPQPDHMAPAAAYLASEESGWASGQVVFSGGPELSVIGPSRLLEVVRSAGSQDFAAALGTIVPVVLGPAEAQQGTTGGSNPRYGNVFDTVPKADIGGAGGNAVFVGRDKELVNALGRALRSWGRTLAVIDGGGSDFTEAERLARQAATAQTVIDSLIVEIPAGDQDEPGDGWAGLVAAHRSVKPSWLAGMAWLRAAAQVFADHPIRVIFVTDATSVAGRTTAQTIAQSARSVSERPVGNGLEVAAVSVESGRDADLSPLAALVARLAVTKDALSLCGAELVVGEGWVGVRNHPGPIATVSFGSIEIPDWVDSALRSVVAESRIGRA
jgi:NAD(P)-dependent dehydrogenase (short-subunit alcohol dehydrogenase family)